jgi:hypothetical protein
MNDVTHNFPRASGVSERIEQIMAMQTIENNPLSADQVEMFAMFETENWSPERRLQHIRDRAAAAAKG